MSVGTLQVILLIFFKVAKPGRRAYVAESLNFPWGFYVRALGGFGPLYSYRWLHGH